METQTEEAIIRLSSLYLPLQLLAFCDVLLHCSQIGSVSMNRQSEKSPQSSSQTPMQTPNEGADFDQWAVAVKRQMIASLKRKGIS